VLIVSSLIFYIFKLVKGTTAEYLLRGLLVLLGALVLSSFLRLNIINYLLTSVFQIGFIALVVLFQPELRRILQQFGTSHKFKLFKTNENEDIKQMRLTIAKTVEAVNSMSWDKIGALIVFERKDNVSSVSDTGTLIDAETSSDLIKNIFYPKSPLHDGAVIMSHGRIKAAGCILPLTANNNISKERE
jgi:diadenylate cyclase